MGGFFVPFRFKRIFFGMQMDFRARDNRWVNQLVIPSQQLRPVAPSVLYPRLVSISRPSRRKCLPGSASPIARHPRNRKTLREGAVWGLRFLKLLRRQITFGVKESSHFSHFRKVWRTYETMGKMKGILARYCYRYYLELSFFRSHSNDYHTMIRSDTTWRGLWILLVGWGVGNSITMGPYRT